MLNKLKGKIRKILPFSSKKYWENRYKTGGNSGAGSYNAKAKYKADVLNNILEEYSIKNLIEFGCGDGNNLKYFNIEYYCGLDVSQTAVEICISTYLTDTKKSFLYYQPSLFKSGGLRSELTISFEVIFHLIEDEVFKKHIYDLFNTSNRYVLICSSNDNELKDNAKHVKHRKFTDNIPNDFSLIKKIETPQEAELKGFFSDFYLFERIN